MLKKLIKNKTRVIVVLILIGILVIIRAFENNLFYDPFLNYFKDDYTMNPIPIYNPVKLFFSLGFRFYLNSIISLALLYLVFKDSKIIKFSTLLYIVLGSILMISFLFILKFFPTEKMTIFYLRRFIIQPIFLILFIPAFYYQKNVK